MLCQITFESVIKLREYNLLLISDTSSMNVEFYSLSHSFYFIILCYIGQKIYLFLWRPAISRFKCPKKLRPAGDCGLLKVSTLNVKQCCDKPSGYVCLSKKCEQGEHEAVTLLYLVPWPSCPTYRVKTQDWKRYVSHR